MLADQVLLALHLDVCPPRAQPAKYGQHAHALWKDCLHHAICARSDSYPLVVRVISSVWEVHKADTASSASILTACVSPAPPPPMSPGS